MCTKATNNDLSSEQLNPVLSVQSPYMQQLFYTLLSVPVELGDCVVGGEIFRLSNITGVTDGLGT